jgi:M6 family metalloprotease-like protein
MRKIIIILLTALFPLCINAQEELKVVRGDCLPDSPDATAVGHRAAQRRLPAVQNDWDPERTYRQLVILIEFADTEFSYTDDAHTFYEKVFNESGFNGDKGPGCVADYYRDQSQGLCNLQFDIYGPYKTSGKAQPYENPTKDTRNYGRNVLIEATNKMLAEHPDIDLSVYDWDGNKSIEQVIYVYAGKPGNLGSATYGHIWPNTSSFATITTAAGYKISNYTCSGELLPASKPLSCGIGTICHEFTHSLGLPDIYPANNSYFSACDEWDLMDGGNFTNNGWCPPNFTAMEKMLLGWLTPIDLTVPTTITDLKPSAEGGEVYRIMHSDSEWLLLENRQQRGWDLGAPGKGLVIYHVNYDGSAWRGNSVNNDKTKRRFYLVPADNMDYDAWDAYIDEKGLSNPYAKSPHMNNRHLSTSPYPYVVDGEVMNNQLTDMSTPAAAMYYPDGSLLGKPITNIRMSEDGLVSFDFMGGDPTGINDIKVAGFKIQECYDLQGRRVDNPQQGNLYIVRTPQGIRKQLYR